MEAERVEPPRCYPRTARESYYPREVAARRCAWDTLTTDGLILPSLPWIHAAPRRAWPGRRDAGRRTRERVRTRVAT